jgi:hypothetical protein
MQDAAVCAMAIPKKGLGEMRQRSRPYVRAMVLPWNEKPKVGQRRSECSKVSQRRNGANKDVNEERATPDLKLQSGPALKVKKPVSNFRNTKEFETFW